MSIKFKNKKVISHRFRAYQKAIAMCGTEQEYHRLHSVLNVLMELEVKQKPTLAFNNIDGYFTYVIVFGEEGGRWFRIPYYAEVNISLTTNLSNEEIRAFDEQVEEIIWNDDGIRYMPCDEAEKLIAQMIDEAKAAGLLIAAAYAAA